MWLKEGQKRKIVHNDANKAIQVFHLHQYVICVDRTEIIQKKHSVCDYLVLRPNKDPKKDKTTVKNGKSSIMIQIKPLRCSIFTNM